ncbi:hypothetical protein BLL52_1301 [Rhodoferax antarcticus ANT.BR]|uniref:Uncharacterized protein n=1 Tax=Rhodoferax antarcticus ANT.BR TaxID=1111071 RepID=A0A1Q8YHD5_9BURK|nr:hypothetical protein BLL52_1301 [Rhodoferax antarcticus ANT.BR]
MDSVSTGEMVKVTPAAKRVDYPADWRKHGVPLVTAPF